MMFFIYVFVNLGIVIDCASPYLQMEKPIKPVIETHQTKSDTYTPQVHLKTPKFFLLQSSAFAVYNFALSDSFNFSCHLDHLPVEFEVTVDKEKSITTMFLAFRDCVLQVSQSVSNVCRKIRR